MKRSAMLVLLMGIIALLFSGIVSVASSPLTAQINGSVVKVPADINVVEGQVMVPLRWAAEQLGASSVQWDSAARTITIKTPQDFYSMEKLDSYANGLQSSIDERNSTIWPLPERAKNLKLSYAVPTRAWKLELKKYNPEREGLTLPKTRDYITIRITSDDGNYEHSSVVYSIDNRHNHFYLPMDWLEYLFHARVSYNETTNVLSIYTADMEKINSEIALIENALIPASADEAIKLWGRGEQTRNGALQYAALSPQLRQIANKSDYVRQSHWVTGGSSPWVGPITIINRNKLSDTKIEYTLSFPEITSTPPYTTSTEKLIVEKLLNNGQEGWYITQIQQSSGYGIIEGLYQMLSNAIDVDVDGDGENETAQIVANNSSNNWELTIKNNNSAAIAEIFKDNKGFSAALVAGKHITSLGAIDFLVMTDYRSMPFGGCGYELYSLKDGALTQIGLSNITNGTVFSINVDESNRYAKINANGASTTVQLSDLDLSGYKLYGNEFCQSFFIDMTLQSGKGEAPSKLVTREVIAATLPHSLTYLSSTYQYVNGAWKIEKTVFSDVPPSTN